MSIHAVTFDCWGTLLLDAPGTDERYKDRRLAGIETVLQTLGIEVDRQRLSHAYETSGRRVMRVWTMNRDVPVRAHVSMLLEAIDPDLPRRVTRPAFASMIEAYGSAALLAPPAVDPGARAAVEALADQGLRLGVISNIMRTPGAVLGQILDQAGLTAFKVLTFSDECGIRKPDPEMFHQTLHQMGVAPEHAVHVGDDPILDVEGALEAGMAVIHVTPDGRSTAPVKPDAVIRGLRELPAALERLAATRVA